MQKYCLDFDFISVLDDKVVQVERVSLTLSQIKDILDNLGDSVIRFNFYPMED